MEDAPPSSRRARRAATGAGAEPTGTEAPVAEGDAAQGDATAADGLDAAGALDALAGGSVFEASGSAPAAERPIALAWLDDAAVAARTAPGDLADSTHPYAEVSPDLLARRPRRSPLRAGVVVPVLTTLGLVGAYAATTLLWPLYAVAPTVIAAPIPDLAAPATAVAWPSSGAAAVGVAGFDTTPATTGDAVPMASITKLVTALMVLDQMPLAVGQSGPSFSFTARDRQTYQSYLARDESALNVPVGGTLTQYQMLQGMLIGSAGNYADRLASTVWPSDAVFASAATSWLAARGLSGITVVEPTGIDPDNRADPASLIALAKVALAHPVIAEIVRTPSVVLPGAGTVVNTNDLLADPGVIGLKTGTLEGAYNLLAAQEQTSATGETVRVFAVSLDQADDEARDGETRRLLGAVAAEASTPTVLPAGTIAGRVTTAWGVSVDVVSDADLSLLLWNGATATVATDLDLGDARATGDAIGTVSASGPLGQASSGVHLGGDVPGPDAWWRLTHPLQLFGLAD